MLQNLVPSHGTPVHQAFVENTIWDERSEDTEDVKEDMDVKDLKVANLVKPYGKVPNGKTRLTLRKFRLFRNFLVERTSNVTFTPQPEFVESLWK